MARSDNKQPKTSAPPRPRGADKPAPSSSDLMPADELELMAPALAPEPGEPPRNPIELPAPINPEGGRKHSVELHRNLFCSFYDGCLDEAVKRGWNSFTCRECEYYHTDKEEGAGVERFATQRRAF